MRESILLVEDDVFLQDLYLRVLRKQGYSVSLAINGIEAIENANKDPNLILLDVMIPILDGISVLRRLKENIKTRHINVVLLTNLGQKNIVKEAMDLGAKGYLLKVRFTPYDLVNQIRYFLDNPNYIM